VQNRACEAKPNFYITWDKKILSNRCPKIFGDVIFEGIHIFGLRLCKYTSPGK
jgi:hypothetical protein